MHVYTYTRIYIYTYQKPPRPQPRPSSSSSISTEERASPQAVPLNPPFGSSEGQMAGSGAAAFRPASSFLSQGLALCRDTSKGKWHHRERFPPAPVGLGLAVPLLLWRKASTFCDICDLTQKRCFHGYQACLPRINCHFTEFPLCRLYFTVSLHRYC